MKLSIRITLLILFVDLFSDVLGDFYDVGKIIHPLNQQFCTFVEVGDDYCSMFVEFRPEAQPESVKRNDVAEMFLGLCNCHLMTKWLLCGSHLLRTRTADCILDPESLYNTTARVHRRMCDLSRMYKWNRPCDCSKEFAGNQLYPVDGFHTCVTNSLPESICKPYNVCGLSKCDTRKALNGFVVDCDENCKGRQPFCEEENYSTTSYISVNSTWAPWSPSICNKTTGFVESKSTCVDKISSSPRYDCIGPGLLCCPKNNSECKCDVFVHNNLLTARRKLRLCENNKKTKSKSRRLKLIQTESPHTLWQSRHIFNNAFGNGIRKPRNITQKQSVTKINHIVKRSRHHKLKGYSSRWEEPSEYKQQKKMSFTPLYLDLPTEKWHSDYKVQGWKNFDNLDQYDLNKTKEMLFMNSVLNEELGNLRNVKIRRSLKNNSIYLDGNKTDDFHQVCDGINTTKLDN